MKKLLLIATVMLGFVLNAQDADTEKQQRAMELMSKKVDMVVDNTLFMNVTPNTYVSENPKGVVMGMYVPETYEASKAKMNDVDNQKFKVTSSGEKKINGMDVLYMYGTSEADGTTLNNKIYCFKVDESSCIMLIGMLDVNADKKYVDALASSLNSAIKK